jgi:hypothetical protein
MSISKAGLKLVINSHIKYSNPLSKLFQSLKNINFQFFQDIIVVLGGCPENKDPEYRLLQVFNKELVVIDRIQNCFDNNGYSALYAYKNHPYV